MWVITIGNAGGVAQSTINQVIDIAQGAADYWGRYIDDSRATIEINIDFEALTGNALANGGTTFFFEQTINGENIFQATTINELQTGVDLNGSSPDIDITIDTTTLNNGEFFLGPLVDGISSGPAFNQFDLFTVLLHEIGHGLGFLSFGFEDNDLSVFDTFVSNIGGEFFFTGPNTVALNGGNNLRLDDDIDHTDAGLGLVLGPTIANGTTNVLRPLDLTIFEDIGVPFRMTTSNADSLYGFFDVADSLSGAGGNDTLFGLSGNDTLDGGADNDTLEGGEGNDILEGGSGEDVAVYDGDRAGYRITQTAGGVIIEDINFSNGNDGADTLTGVEQAVFNGVAESLATSAATEGDDTLDGTAAAENIDGLGGNDLINGLGGGDTLVGGEGDDTLIGGEGTDDLTGGAGIDTASYADATGGVSVNLINGSTITGGSLNSGGFYVGGAIEDTLIEIENIIGSAFGDRLVGASTGNVIEGGDGGDNISGLNGDDTLRGGVGNDTLDGGGDNDIVDYSDASGGVSVDLLNGAAFSGGSLNSSGAYVGGSLEDTLISIEGVTGSAFRDLIVSSNSNATIDGAGGSDNITSFSGADTLIGGEGNDTLVSGGNSDLLQGGTSNDVLNGGTGFDTIDGGTGLDTVDYSDRTGGVGVNAINGTAETGGSLNSAGFYTGGFTEDQLISVENIIGSDFGDRLVGFFTGTTVDGRGGDDNISSFSGNDSITGGTGNDTLAAGGGTDQLLGGEGDDHLNGGTGFDTLDGGAGSDTADYSDRDGGVGINLTNGTGQTAGFLNSGGFYQGGFTEDQLIGIENIIGSNFADRLVVASAESFVEGGDGGDRISGLSGQDSLAGQDGDDTLEGGQNFDTLNGGAGNDLLNGGTGFDTLDGGADIDTVDYGDRTGGVSINLISNTGVTAGFLNANGFYQGGFTEDQLANIENIIGSEFADRLIGNNSENRLEGSGGADRISAFNGNDTIIGGAGDDTLEAGAGDDLLIYALGDGADVVSGFTAGVAGGDVLDVSGLGAAFDTFAEITNAATQNGADTVITFGGGDSITLVNTTLTDLNADDFLFT